MSSLNRVSIIGRLGKDPETRGQACSFSVATSESWNDGSGERKTATEWHNIVVWGKMVEHCQRYLAKGKLVYVEGKLKTRQWEDKKHNMTRYSTEIVASTVKFLSPASAEPAQPSATDTPVDPFPEAPSAAIFVDPFDIPL